ncbi:hypothetical protein TWF102_011847 [Orbilia oligospora]|uniref:FHA domain-containing protein n=1 Tax=Orbilia oligospora TaxID=2813651 RepID=A0A7C8N5M0_ORBOL|nr:hypothetical protein TWF102_011847 [Orbilia oligospora]KAF3111118.1 hypothetical protein TWF103_003802 [Orbilia oligospora]KAF3115612.1 hypothetical protein TWF706_005728 [Orbilia oligospora]KAF3132995.1 hypothetical protein TWF703_007134 [Orbilia oligospora]
MATPPFTSSPALATRGQLRQHSAVPPSSPPIPFLSRKRSLKRTASASSSIDPDSPSDRPSKRRALRSLRRTNSVSGSELAGNENARLTPFPATPPRILKRMPSLLPAIDFQASPPRQVRPAKSEQASDQEPVVVVAPEEKANHYPTPVPTSEIGIPTSPAPKVAAPVSSRQGLNRTNSAFSELRAPLVSVPTVTLPKNCQPVTFGRSVNKCTYLMSKSHTVSRVHFKVTYLGFALRKSVEVHCVGYNGGRVHCRGDTWELRYGDIFWSESGDDIMVETDNTRVVIRWPSDDLQATSPVSPVIKPVVIPSSTFPYPAEYDLSIETKARNGRPFPTEGVEFFGKFTHEPVPKMNIPKPRNGSIDINALTEPAPLRLSREPWNNNPDSPCPQPKRQRLMPVSPLPFAILSTSQSNFTLYEDEDDEDDDVVLAPISPVEDDGEEDYGFVLRESEKPEALNTEVELDDDEEDEEEEEEEGVNDNEEEDADYDDEDSENVNESAAHTTPTKHTAKSQKLAYKLKHKLDESVSQDPLTPKSKISLMKHLSNQIAFSRLASTPLSNLIKSLPPGVREKVSVEFVQALLTSVPCIGEIKREGKDASGKLLEPEYYYIADMDFDLDRKSIVCSLNKPSLRSCRKTHKQYFWKKPKV